MHIKILLLITFLITTVFAINHHQILLRQGAIDTTRAPQAHDESFLSSLLHKTTAWIGGMHFEEEEEKLGTYLFHLNEAKSFDTTISELKKMGIRIGDYIPFRTFIGTGTPSQVKRARRVSGVKWIGKYESKHKMPNEDVLKKHMDWHVSTYGGLKSGGRKLHQLKDEVDFLIFANTAPHNSKQELQKQVDIWQSELKRQLGDSLLKMKAVSNSKIAVGVKGSNAATHVSKYLSADGLIHWVEVKPPAITHNKYASQLVQSYKEPSKRPLWNRGINGKGQIIGVGDTGIDIYHCLFYDDQPVPFVANMSQPPPVSKHRKFAAYWEYMDRVDSRQGHGTHVGATASGAAHPTLSPPGLSEWNSLDYASKLAFIDAGCDTDTGCYCPHDVQCECEMKPGEMCKRKFGVVYLPLDLSDGYFPWFYKQGARVSSNSWGTGYYKDFTFGYSISSSEIDKFIWDHKDFLAVFAAGNSGGVFGYGSLTTEAESKNVLSIGASQSSFESFKETTNLTDLTQQVDRARLELYSAYCTRDSDKYDPDLCAYAKDFDEEMCCDDRIDGKRQCPTPSVTCCGVQLFPHFKRIGFRCCEECINLEMEKQPEHFSEKNLAHFTARGSALDGRIKPDVVTVGNYIISAKSLGSDESKKCNPSQKVSDLILKHEGTSMAAPVAASAAILVRQYFVDGYYPSGEKVAAQSFEPSAALMKAMLIHSAELLTGKLFLSSQHKWWDLTYKSDQRFSLKSPFLQGFGRIDLNNVLAKDAGLYIPNIKDRTISTGDIHYYCMNVKSMKKPFKVTLVWTDPPSSPAAKINLVNDLDLIVVAPNKKAYFGNGLMSPVGSTRNEPDYLNNVEQLVFSGTSIGKYNVIVRGKIVAKGPQPYALVISGDMEQSKGCGDISDLVFTPTLQKYMSLTYAFGMLCFIFIPALCLLTFYFCHQHNVVTTSPTGWRKTSLAKTEKAVSLKATYQKIPESDVELQEQ